MADDSHILIVEARFYPDISDELLRGATAALTAAGVSFDRVEVPGVFEIPAASSAVRPRITTSSRTRARVRCRCSSASMCWRLASAC
jgi:hypothetical protein